MSAYRLSQLIASNEKLDANNTRACVAAALASMHSSLKTLRAEVHRDCEGNGDELPQDVTSLLGCLRVFYLVQCLDVNLLRNGK